MSGGTGSCARLRQHLLDQYRSAQLVPGAEPGPCREARLLQRARLYLRRTPRPGGVFTVFPFPEAVTGGPEARETISRKYLKAFIKAAELLESFSAHILQQPWRREIRRIRSFTGVFVYHLLPVLSSSVLQSVLQSLGYLPDVEVCPREFRLREDVDVDRVVLLGFELMLARLDCAHLLKELQRDNLETLDHTKLSEFLQRREASSNQREEVDGKAVRQEEQQEEEEQSSHLSQSPELPDVSAPRAHRHTLTTVDHSIMEMQRTYPDLAFRGRRLLATPPSKFPSSESFAAGAQAAVPVQRSSKNCTAEEPPNDRSRAGVEPREGPHALDGRPAVSLHITLRTGKYQPQVVSSSSIDEELRDHMEQLCVQENQEPMRRKQGGEECPQRPMNE